MLTVVDGYIRNKNISKLMEEEEHICKKIRYSTPKFMLGDAIQSGDILSVIIFKDVNLVNRGVWVDKDLAS